MPVQAAYPKWRYTKRICLIAVCTRSSQRLHNFSMPLLCSQPHRTPSRFSDSSHVGASCNQQAHIIRAPAPRSQRYQPRLSVLVAFTRVNTQQVPAAAQLHRCSTMRARLAAAPALQHQKRLKTSLALKQRDIFNLIDVLPLITQPPQHSGLSHPCSLQRLRHELAVNIIVAVIRSSALSVPQQHSLHLLHLRLHVPLHAVRLLPKLALTVLLLLQSSLSAALFHQPLQLLPHLVHAELKPRQVNRLLLLLQLLHPLCFQVHTHPNRNNSHLPRRAVLHAPLPARRNIRHRQKQRLLLLRILRKLAHNRAPIHGAGLNLQHHGVWPPLSSS